MKSKKTLNMRALSALLASTLAISAVFAPTAFAQDCIYRCSSDACTEF